VVDDGAGIARDDLLMAFARHATSKIASLDDLEQVLSLGFRGEALASIARSRASVWRAAPPAQTAPSPFAPRRQHRQRRARRSDRPATTVEVDDLYYNTPARRKFLKSEATEFGHCEEVFTRAALSRPGSRLSLRHNGRVVARASGRATPPSGRGGARGGVRPLDADRSPRTEC